MNTIEKIVAVFVSLAIFTIYINVVLFTPEYATALELKGIGDEVASEWAEDAILYRIDNWWEECNTQGESTAWRYQYYSPSSAHYNATFNSTIYQIISLTINANGKIKQDRLQYESSIYTTAMNLTMDSTEAFEIALTRSGLSHFLDQMPGSTIVMYSYSCDSFQFWEISANADYGPDMDKNSALITVNCTSSEIEYEEMHIEGNSWFYICTICPILVIVIIVLIIYVVVRWMRKHWIRHSKAIKYEVPQSPENSTEGQTDEISSSKRLSIFAFVTVIISLTGIISFLVTDLPTFIAIIYYFLIPVCSILTIILGWNSMKKQPSIFGVFCVISGISSLFIWIVGLLLLGSFFSQF